MEATLPVHNVNHVLYSIMPYDLVPYAVSAFYASYHELPDGRDTQVITLTTCLTRLTSSRGGTLRGCRSLTAWRVASRE